MIEGKKCENVTLKVRKIGKWVEVNTRDLFKGKRVILFSLSGALLLYVLKSSYSDLKKIMKLCKMGIDEIYCISVNDGFGMRDWRYCAIINDEVIEKWWQERGINNIGNDTDPYEETAPENCIKYLKGLVLKKNLKSA